MKMRVVMVKRVLRLDFFRRNLCSDRKRSAFLEQMQIALKTRRRPSNSRRNANERVWTTSSGWVVRRGGTARVVLGEKISRGKIGIRTCVRARMRGRRDLRKCRCVGCSSGGEGRGFERIRVVLRSNPARGRGNWASHGEAVVMDHADGRRRWGACGDVELVLSHPGSGAVVVLRRMGHRHEALDGNVLEGMNR